MTDLLKLNLEETKNALKNKEFSAVELTKAYLEMIEKYEKLNTYITVTASKALEMAEQSDKKIKTNTSGPLEGIPFGIKDLFCTKNIKTTAASKILSNFIPPIESTVTKKLWDSGAVLLGKCNMDEFAMGSTNMDSYYGPTLNPWRRANQPDLPLVPGGSSGASAVSIAANLALGSLGSDTGGSIRQPASFCGVVGIKPTYGRCSRFGMIAFASSLDCPGPFARNVKDSAIILENIAGYDSNDATSLDVDVPQYSKNINPDMKGKKIAVFKEYLEGLDEEGLSLMREMMSTFESGGAVIDIVDFPLLKYALPIYYIIAPAEASSNLACYDGVKFGLRTEKEFSTIDEMYELTRQEGFGPEVKRRIFIGTYVLSSSHYDAYYMLAQKLRKYMIRDLSKIFETHDFVISPTTPTDAFALKERPTCPQTLYLCDIYTVPVNLAGLPGISVPVKRSAKGTPLSLQIFGPKLSEQTLFNAAQFIETAVKFSHLEKVIL